MTCERLDALCERELAILLAQEIDFQLKIEQLKQDLESLSGFQIRKAFKAVDYLNYRFIDEAALRRFLKKIGH